MAPQVSPDGTRIAFEVHQAERDKDRRISHIWMVAAGEQPVQLTRGENGDSSARWSPDGRRLAFISARGAADAKPLVWLLELDGGEARRVTQTKGGVADFSWSPDGARIAFASVVTPKPEQGAPAGAKPIVVRRLLYKAEGRES